MKSNEIIKKLRKENNYTQEGLGKLVGVSRELVSNWEKGKRTPTIEGFKALSKIFNVPIEFLTGEKPEKPSAKNLTKQVEVFFMAEDVTQEIKDQILQDIMELYWGNKHGKSKKKGKGNNKKV